MYLYWVLINLLVIVSKNFIVDVLCIKSIYSTYKTWIVLWIPLNADNNTLVWNNSGWILLLSIILKGRAIIAKRLLWMSSIHHNYLLLPYLLVLWTFNSHCCHIWSHVTRKHLFLMKPKPMAGLHSDTKYVVLDFLKFTLLTNLWYHQISMMS